MNIINKENFRKSISSRDVANVIARQVNNMIPDIKQISEQELLPYINSGSSRLYNCFKGINNKYYNEGGEIVFNHLHSDHYCSFLYLVSNEAFCDNATELATKIFLLNKYLHGLDLYFSVTLPEVFLLVHPVGSVIGNAEYSNKIVIYQNCSIGSVFTDGKYIYPKFGENIVLYSRTSIIGECVIGNNVIFGANSFVIKSNVPNNSIVTGAYPQLKVNVRPVVDVHFFY
jgi:serine O-acetyltransferase